MIPSHFMISNYLENFSATEIFIQCNLAHGGSTSLTSGAQNTGRKRRNTRVEGNNETILVSMQNS